MVKVLLARLHFFSLSSFLSPAGSFAPPRTNRSQVPRMPRKDRCAGFNRGSDQPRVRIKVGISGQVERKL